MSQPDLIWRTVGPMRGMALLMVLIILAVASLMATAFLSAVGTAAMTGRDLSAQTRARLIAESGLALALSHIRENPTWRTQQSNGTWVADESFGDGSFTLVVEDGTFDPDLGVVVGDASLADDPTEPATITCTGVLDGVTHTVRSTATPVFVNAGGLSVSEGISMSNSAAVDAWNSALGAYGPSNSGSSAVVTTNSITEDAVSLSHTATIAGSVLVGPGGNPAVGITLTGQGSITGSNGALPEPVSLDATPFPTTPLPSLGNLTVTSSLTVPASLHVNNLSLLQNANVTIQGNVTLICDGDFQMGNNSRLVLAPDSTLTLFVAGRVLLQQSAELNIASGDPRLVHIYAYGMQGVETDNFAQVYANVRALNGDFTMKQHSKLFGTFQGRALSMANNTEFHQDLNPQSGSFPILTGFSAIWFEPR